jgi:hypothetical protein
MDTGQINKLCVSLEYSALSKWYPFAKIAADSAPSETGTYFLRMAGGLHFGRLKGSSDILYIGSTEGRDGLKGRLSDHLHPAKEDWTSQRIKSLSAMYKIEVAWSQNDSPRHLELLSLRQCLTENLELPPLNHSRRWKALVVV